MIPAATPVSRNENPQLINNMIHRLPHYVRGLSLVAALAAAATTKLSAQAFVGSDTFNTSIDPAWPSAFRLLGASGIGYLDFTGSQVQFTTSISGTGSYFRIWGGDGTVGAYQAPASYTNSWVMNLQVVDTFSTSSGFASIGLQVDSGITNTSYAAVMLQNIAGAYRVRAEGTGTTFLDTSATGCNSNVWLSMAWDAGSQVLSSYYSFDNGNNYTLLKSFDPNTQWTVGLPTGGFEFEIFGSASGTATAITTGMYADNFSVSAIPEPSTYAALAGACALGLAIWKRKRKAPAF